MKRLFCLKQKERCLLSFILKGTTLKKAGLIILFFLFLENNALAQNTDSVIKAHFVYPNSELDSFLVDNLVRPIGCQWFGVNAKVDVVFIVDTFGRVNNLQVINFEPYVHKSNNKTYTYYKSEYSNLLQMLNKPDSTENLDSSFINEARRVIKFTSGLWYPAQANRKPISSEITLSIMFEGYNVKASNRKQSRYRPRSESLLDYEYAMNKEHPETIFDIPADNPTKYYNLGVKKLTQKKYLLAHKYFLTAVTLDKSDADAWYNLGVTNHLIKNKIEACQCWVKAMQLGVYEARENIEKYCK
jgi:tetratricopeptide (TPR) repeat protein